MSLNRSYKTDPLKVFSATVHMLKGKPHFTETAHGDVWVLTREERDAVLHSVKEFNHVRTQKARLERRLAAKGK